MFVKLWMRNEVITILPDATIAETCSLMDENRIRRIPVINQENQLLGIISKEDLKKALPSAVDASLDETSRALANQVKIETFMTQTPVTVSPIDTLEKVATIMRQHKIGGIPVVENELLVGIITESDIFDAFVEVLGGSNKDTRVEFSIPHDTSSIYKVFDILAEHDTQLNNIVICNNHSVKTKTVTLRFTSTNTQELIDELWKAGCKISSIIPDL
jgi:acetoin utilization protein AcuB